MRAMHLLRGESSRGRPPARGPAAHTRVTVRRRARGSTLNIVRFEAFADVRRRARGSTSSSRIAQIPDITVPRDFAGIAGVRRFPHSDAEAFVNRHAHEAPNDNAEWAEGESAATRRVAMVRAPVPTV